MPVKNKKPLSFLGVLIFLIAAFFIVYLCITVIRIYQINEISKINTKYEITEENLIPKNYTDYKLELAALKHKRYTEPIIRYIDFIIELEKLEKLIEFAYLESGCVSRNTNTKLEMQEQETELLLETFTKISEKKTNKIFWYSYLSSLKEYEVSRLRNKIEKIENCYD